MQPKAPEEALPLSATLSLQEGILYCALLMFALSVVSWLLDNYFCSVLRNLPGGLPYPQLHTWWHVLIAMTLHPGS